MLAALKTALIVVALSLVLPGLSAHCQPTGTRAKVSSDSAKKASSDSPQEIELRSVLITLEQAIASKNAEKIGALFAEDTVFIDQSGDQINGRTALQDRFAQLLKGEAVSVLGLHPERTSFPASNVGLVVGVVSRRHEQDDLPMTRFSMVVVKRGGAWLINELTETVMQTAQTESRLRDLSWLIGDWRVDKTDASAQMNVEWAPGKKFIISKTILNKKGTEPQIDSQVIGWDPQGNRIVSWHFDSNGGFGSGTWTRKPAENQWTVAVDGVGADGSNTSASNVFAQKSADEFVWQSIHRSLDGVAVTDTECLTVRRVTH